jgi:hypothetical protein
MFRILIGAGLILAPAAVQAQTLDGQSTGLMRATVVRPIAVVEISQLNFGVVFPSASPSRITVTPAGDLVLSDPAQVSGGAHSAGVFEVDGQAGRAFSITLPPTITLNGPASTLTVDELTYALESPPPSGPAQPNSDTVFRFGVGGVLTLPPAQAPGRYTGVYAVTVTYQ